MISKVFSFVPADLTLTNSWYTKAMHFILDKKYVCTLGTLIWIANMQLLIFTDLVVSANLQVRMPSYQAISGNQLKGKKHSIIPVFHYCWGKEQKEKLTCMPICSEQTLSEAHHTAEASIAITYFLNRNGRHKKLWEALKELLESFS